MDKNVPLLVTTEFKGVFFGYGCPLLPADRVVRLEKARMCVYWPREVKSVLGLAVTGPLPGSRIGPAVAAITLPQVTSLIEVDEEAVKRFEVTTWCD